MITITPLEALRGCRYAVVQEHDGRPIVHELFRDEAAAALYCRQMYNLGYHDWEVVAIDFGEA